MRDVLDLIDHSSLSDEPTYRLAVATLGMAIHDAVRVPPKKASEETVKKISDQRADALLWLTSQDSGPLSAESIMDLMGLKPERVRHAILTRSREIESYLRYARKKAVASKPRNRSEA
ncbi:hypothetical protein [Spiribacter onubensis]|uniref:Uncharacterized protein n=1 Tax=Spiribacter onubensis TaxID=3122420 RepID=A0ABV3S931_9GAMM